MDRLGRNLEDLRALVRGLTSKGVRLEFLEESCLHSLGHPMASSMLSVTGDFDEFEPCHDKMARDGISLAKQQAPTKAEKDLHTGT